MTRPFHRCAPAAFDTISLGAMKYYSAPESVMAKVGIGSDGQPATSFGDSERLTCRICCDEYKGKDAYALACNHLFCRGCWTMYLRAKASETGGWFA